MAKVDPEDDSIDRWVVYCYGYDPQRHERRYRVVAAFDNQREFEELLHRNWTEMGRRRAAGEESDPRESYSGAHLEAGYRQRQQVRRTLWRAIGRAELKSVRERLDPKASGHEHWG